MIELFGLAPWVVLVVCGIVMWAIWSSCRRIG